MTTFIAGIDPGTTGAIAWVGDDGSVIVADLPMIEVRVGKTLRKRLNVPALRDMIDARRPVAAYVEEVATRPGEGAVGAFSFGRGFGQIEGLLAGLSIAVAHVKPQSWKRGMGITGDKGATRLAASYSWPALAGSFARVKDDGRADACFIAAYGARLMAKGVE